MSCNNESFFDDISEHSLNSISSSLYMEVESDEEPECLMDVITDDDLMQVENEIYKDMDLYLSTNVIELSNPLWIEKYRTTVVDLIYETISSMYDVLDYVTAYNEVAMFVYERIEVYTKTIMTPPRSYTMGYKNPNIEKDKNYIENKIDFLRKTFQPQQRTKEWYEFRHNLLTASNVNKVLGSESKKNSLIYEKCQPVLINNLFDNNVNVNSPMHWGNKYEPISIMIYEDMNETEVDDFGCIRHSEMLCLGASPDGINVKKDNDLFGRMIEVKNIVNREINGIPLEAYWIQMQVQMEVCDLEECDFIETRIKEYDDIEQFYGDDKEYCGVIIYFVSKTELGSKPHYVYMPLTIKKDYDTINRWIEGQKVDLQAEFSLYTVLYWYLDEISCVLVTRNKKWFSALKPHVISTWETIKTERVSGYEHRKPKSRKKSNEM